MTDKEQIIVDGMDVGGCKYLNTFSDCDGYHYYCDLADDIKNEYCEYYKDCYFKQLARKTQECENLKAEEKYLKQCCEKAGEELSKHSFDYDGKEKNLVIQAMELNEKYEKFEKALEEIEEELKEDIYCESQECGCDDFEECLRCTKEHILDIINKAKGGLNEK